jgi:hypothetical protein
MNIEKIIKKTNKKVSGLRKLKMVKVKSLTRKHFKRILSTDIGFGFQDMKKKPKRLFETLIIEGYDVHVIPKNTINMEVDIFVKI